ADRTPLSGTIPHWARSPGADATGLATHPADDAAGSPPDAGHLRVVQYRAAVGPSRLPRSHSLNTFLPFIVAALATAQAAPASPPAGSEWPAYKGNAGLSGVSADDSIRPPFKLLWSYRLDGDASSDAGAGVTVAGGKVFVNVHNTRSILA